MQWDERIENYAKETGFPKCLFVGPDGRAVGTWIMGNDYRVKSTYYGGYPAGYLRRVKALFPDKKHVLHLFSGQVDLSTFPGDTVDINESLKPTYVDDAQTLTRVPLQQYDLVLADPPYSVEDAEHYQTTMVKRNVVMRALQRLPIGAHIVWLDQVLPMYRKDAFEQEAAIGMWKSTNHRFRGITIFCRRDAAASHNVINAAKKKASNRAEQMEAGEIMSIASRLADIPHPGEFVRDELEARGWSQRDLSYILNAPEQAVNMIIAGKRGISPEMALAFGKAFDVSAEYWANIQQSYEMANARRPDPGIERRAVLQGTYPVREMIRRGWLENGDIGLLEAQMMRFFCKNDLSDIPYLAHAAKKSDYAETTPSQLAWLFRVRQLAAEMIVPIYSEIKLKKLIAEFPRYMIDPEEVRHVPRMLSECGVRFLIVETLPKANIDGVCFWLGDSPVVGMTIRQDRIDNFWFVLRHELEHVLQKHGRGQTLSAESVDTDLECNDLEDDGVPDEERIANNAAADFCAPRSELNSFYLRKSPFISEKDTLGFARRIQRHPGIVVAQLQRKMGRYDWLARYKVKVRQFVAPASVVDGWGVPAPASL